MAKISKDNYESFTYKELEDQMEQILSKLNDSSLSLDEQVTLGEKGQEIIKEMESRLSVLKEKVDKLSSSNTKGEE